MKDLINYKLRVFISSKCGGRYSILRRALQVMLEQTGFIEVYNFDKEPASSEKMPDSYLNYVDQSNLLIVLIDNNDGVTTPVFEEVKRANTKNLRVLYVFCDEKKKEPTLLQEKVKDKSKYIVVHEFSDIIIEAYKSVVQDVIGIYTKKKESCETKKSEKEVTGVKELNTEIYSFKTVSFSEHPLVASVFKKNVFTESSFKKEDEETSLEKLLSEQLQTVIFKKSFDKTIIDSICNEVTKGITGDLCEILKIRYEAQKFYYSFKYDECLKSLQKAVSIAKEKQSIPIWVVNDLAIDIRYVVEQINERNNKITSSNPGQKLIDESNQPLYFPYLDRQVEIMQEEIIKEYYSQLSNSPYTIEWHNKDRFFSSLANAFCIAEMHGSIVETEITRDRIISIFSMLCTFDDDHELLVEYIKYLIINCDKRKLDAVIRTYNQSAEIINAQEIDSIINCIDNMFDPIKKIKAKYLLASRLGYYMSDTAYSALYIELIDYAMKWVEDDKSVYSINTFIFEFFKKTTYRMEEKDIIDFICKVFRQGLRRFYGDCFKILNKVDFEKITEEDQHIVKQILLDEKIKENEKTRCYFLAVTKFCKTAEVSCDDLKKEIENMPPSIDKDNFLLDMQSQSKQEFYKYILKYINEAKLRNEKQGTEGIYYGYAYESLDIVYSIIRKEEITIKRELIESIINVVIEVLSSERQTIDAKRSAVRLLQFVYLRSYKEEELWDKMGKKMEANSETFSIGREVDLFSKETNYILSFQYNLFMYSFFNRGVEGLVDQLYSPDSLEAYTINQFLRIITDFLECTKGKNEDETLISAFLYYSIFMSRHKEESVKYNASICLIELTNFRKVKRLALIHLSRIMDTGSEKAKIGILSRLGKIQVNEDDSHVKEIVNQGKSDSNYLVRSIAVYNNP